LRSFDKGLKMVGDAFLSQDSEQVSLLRLQIYSYDAKLVSTTSSAARSLNVALRKAARYTGKERDVESGNDYFGARYYSNSTGRFLSPDYSGDADGPPDPLPYGDLNDPQSLNLYSYVRNNPLSRTDSDGHDCIYINNDTGQFQGFNSGDCDNSTEASANSGYYVNGTVNTISTSTGDANGVVTGYTGTSETGSILSGAFASPLPSTGGFDPGTLGASVFGAGNASTFNNAFGVVNAAGNAELAAAGFAFPLEHLAVTLLSATRRAEVSKPLEVYAISPALLANSAAQQERTKSPATSLKSWA
jgi:RHS repeat-associated protein